MPAQKEKIVIIGANCFQLPLIKKAKEKGYETHVFAWEKDADGKEFADFFYPISITEKDKILSICRDIKPVGIVTIASELANITVNYIAEKLGLVCNGIETTRVSTNKYLMRQAFDRAGIACPKFAKITGIDDVYKVQDFTYPLIIKPTDRSGSRGINKVCNKAELLQKLAISLEQSLEYSAIVEEFIDGDEFSCEGISYNGKHQFLTLTRKYTTEAPHFIETGHIVPSGLDEKTIQNVYATISKALDALGIKFGASHSEFRINARGEARIIEIGSRMGGDYIGSHLVELSTGYDFVGMVVDCCVGKHYDTSRKQKYENAFVKFVFNSEDAKNINEFIEAHPEYLIEKHIANTVGNAETVLESAARYGYAVFAGADRAIAERLLDRDFCEKTISLRPLSLTDTDNIVRWRNSPSVLKNFLDQNLITSGTHIKYYNDRVLSGKVAQYIISSGGKDVGSVYLRDIDNTNHTAEFEIFIGEESFRGKGIGTWATREMINMGFNQLGLKKICLRVMKENKTGQKTYLKNGFVFDKEENGVIYMTIER